MDGLPALLADRFELGQLIGRGSISQVYSATDRVTRREVAVKLPPREEAYGDAIRHRFEREAAALAVIASDHVVELIAAGSAADGRPFLVLERLRGRDLQAVIAESGSLAPDSVAACISQAGAALELAHGLDIVHRDLKPANLFWHTPPGAAPTLKVLDFGMVVDVGGPTERGRDAFGGTPMYMAPEQVRGQLTRIGPATDIWALALVAITLLTGESYWPGATVTELMQQIESSPLKPPSERWAWLPEAFDGWFLRSTQRVPERRFRSVAEQASHLKAALRGVVAPTHATAAAAIASASTISARTPTPSVVRLPGQGRSVVGRQIECAEIEARLAPGAVVTLTGTAGIGKTCLAQLVIATLGDRYPDGAWLVALGSGAGANPLATAIAHALSIEVDSGASRFDLIATQLGHRQALVVVDGAEQEDSAAQEIARLRRACPAISWLVTSRMPLGIDGERALAVEPLDLPGADVDAITAGEARTFSAVELLVRRAREAAPGFAMDDDNAGDIVAICRLVDGFPLDLELAAARLAAASPADVRRELQARGAVDPGSRVRAAVAWSYGLLPDGECAVLRHLAVYPAGLTFVRAQRLLAHLVYIPATAVLKLVQSQLLRWTGGDRRRLIMLDTVRELCREESARLGEQDALWEVARQFGEQMASWDSAGADSQEEWLEMVDAEHDNLRAVLQHFLDHEPEVAMRLAGQLAWYWYLRGHYAEGSRWLEGAIARSADPDDGDLTRALYGAGRLALLACDYDRARAHLERARGLAFRSGDQRGEANALQLLGSVARERGAYAQALDLHRGALRLWRELGDAHEVARTRNYLAFAAWLGDPAGDPGAQRSEPSLDELRALGDPEAVVWALLNRGAIAHYAGDREAARDILARAFAESIAARFHEGIAWSLNLIGLASFDRGEHLQARAQLAAALRVHRRLGDRWRCASVLEALAAVAVSDDHATRAGGYLGVADALREQIATPVPACELPLLELTEQRGEALIGFAFHAARERGRRTSLDDIIELARELP